MKRKPAGPLGLWSIPREWEGETAFIVGGGPTALRQNLDLLRGHRVIAVNARYQDVPFADFVFGIDSQFFDEHRAALQKFGGRVVTTVQSQKIAWPGLLKVKHATAPGHDDPQAVYCSCTSLAGASDLARWLGAKRQVWIGADGHDTPEARKHHAQRYPNRPHRNARYRDWEQELKRVVARMRERGIEILNASPGSAYAGFIPEVRLEDVVRPAADPGDDRRHRGADGRLHFRDDAMTAAHAVLAEADARGKSRVKIDCVHLRALVNEVTIWRAKQEAKAA